MAARKKQQPPSPSISSPSQQDEADILDEADARHDDETGDLVASEESVRELGAIDADSVRENRRVQEMVNKKRGGVKDVQFNIPDVIAKYDALIGVWPASTLHINVRRLTGTPVQHVITSNPRSGSELYETLRALHGPNQEAEYELKFFDANGKSWRANGRITMPDARPPQQQGQPMNPYYPPPPPGYPPPYGYPPQSPTPAAPQPQATAAGVGAPPAPPPPVVVAAPPWPTPPQVDPMAMLSQAFEMFQRLQPPQAQQAPVYQMPAPPPPVMPPPPTSSDPAALMGWAQQLFEMFTQLQARQASAPPTAQAPTAPTATPTPPMQVPPGMIFVPNIGFVPLAALAQALSPEQPQRRPAEERRQREPSNPMHRDRAAYREDGYGPSPPTHASSPYARPAPRYDGREREYDERDGRGYDGRGYAPSHIGQQQGRPQQPSFRDALTVVRETVAMAQEAGSLIGGDHGSGHQVTEAPESDEDDSPIRVVDMGPAKAVLNKHDGSLRMVETGWANMDKVLKFVAEQSDKIRQAHAEKQQQQRAPQQLPPGFVEVGPGYQPPPGFVVVPVDPQETASPLQPPPEHVPPPVRPQSWGLPHIPGS